MSSTLDAALEAAISTYRAGNPRSEAQLSKAAQSMPGGNTRSVLFYAPFPLTMTRGEGCRLWDMDGHRYLDAIGEFSAALYGHSHPVILDAIKEALDRGLNLCSHTEQEAVLAEEIQQRFSSMQLLRFANSGTEANLLALAAAVAHTGRRKIIVFDGAYHGGVLTFAGGSRPLNVPHEFLIAQYNDIESVKSLVKSHGDELAAILVEPMLGAGGCIPAEPSFLSGLKELCADSGSILIFDEVMTSRLSIGGRQKILGIQPDLTVLGKYLGGGMSFGAFGGRREIMARFDPSSPGAYAHAGTFNNNVLTMAAGIAGLKKVLDEETLKTLNNRGEDLRQRLNNVFATRGHAVQFTGLGSLMTMHTTNKKIATFKDLDNLDPRVKELIFFKLVERGIYIARRGFMTLALPFGNAEADELVNAFTSVVDEIQAFLPSV